MLRIRSTHLIRNILLLATFVMASNASAEQSVFDTPDAAVKTLIEALSADDIDELSRIFGTEHRERLLENDNEDARRDRAVISERAKSAGTRLSKVSKDKQIVLIGEANWPFPVPLVRVEKGWRFDTEEGLEEIANRRVGENETNAITVVRVYGEAQREYAREDRDGDLVREFAQRLISTPGKRDGLFWPSTRPPTRS